MRAPDFWKLPLDSWQVQSLCQRSMLQFGLQLCRLPCRVPQLLGHGRVLRSCDSTSSGMSPHTAEHFAILLQRLFQICRVRLSFGASEYSYQIWGQRAEALKMLRECKRLDVESHVLNFELANPLGSRTLGVLNARPTRLFCRFLAQALFQVFLRFSADSPMCLGKAENLGRRGPVACLQRSSGRVAATPPQMSPARLELETLLLMIKIPHDFRYQNPIGCGSVV